MLLRHLYYFCSRCDVSLNQRLKMMTKSKNVLSNQLMDAINNSMSTKIGGDSHNVLGISKK